MKPFLAWLRRQIAWSNSRRSWYERLGTLALVAAGSGGWWLSGNWSLEGQVLLLALWLVLFAILLRRGIVRLAGPVFFFEVLRGSRRRIHAARILFLLILFLTISYVWYLTSESDIRYESGSQIQLQSQLASTLFASYFGIQMMVIAVVTPVMAAGAIADEKERRTLEFILATDLRSREIVLGKLAARSANLLLILIAGLPVLAVLQFLGGIDPGELLAAFAVTLLTLFSVASLSILMSALLRRGRDAILSTFLLIFAYLALSGLARLGIGTDFGNASGDLGGYAISGQDLIEAFGAGNPLIGLATIVEQLNGGATLAEVLRDLVRDYALFHLATTVVCVAWAAMRLRPVALGQGNESRNRRWTRKRRLPKIGRHPMAWKELFAEPGLRLHLVLRLLIVLLVIASFWPPARMTFEYWIKLDGPMLGYQVSSIQRDYHEEMNIWVRGMSAALGSLLLLGVAMRAAGSITGERSRQTLDELLTTPLSNDEIIQGKWLGALLGMRRGWLWLGSVYLVGLAAGGLNFFAGILTVAAWFGFACFFASLGLWFSANCRNSFRSTTLTMICSAFCLCLHWAATMIFCFLPLMLVGGGLSRDLRWLTQIQAGFTPPFTLAFFSFWDVADENHISERTVGFVIASIIGLAAYSLAGWGLLRATVVRFAHTYHRTAIRQPRQASQNSSAGLAKPAE